MKVMLSTLSLALMLLVSCAENDLSLTVLPASTNPSTIEEPRENPSKENYWYNNEAEISSYKLSQARYGEMHEGTAVLVFVTEQFSSKNGTKADNPTDKDVSVLKLNFTKKFNTGIYPYSMMASTFFPFENGVHSLKVSNSSQEWCGHTYMELSNKKQFEIQVSSYFEGESGNFTIKKDYLEDDIWSMIRLNPTGLPIGNFKVIPSFFYSRLLHQEIKAHNCQFSSSKVDDNITSYTINYPDLERKLSINYEAAFPHRIISWEETYASGWGKNKKVLKTTASLIKTIKTDYWNKHSNKDAGLRVELGLGK